MKILFVSGQNKKYDGRTKALLDILNQIADVKEYTYTNEPDCSDETKIHSKSYIGFCVKLLNRCKKYRNIDCLFLDNRRSSLPGLILNKFLSPKILIYDARELYFYDEMVSFSGRLGCILEKRIMNKANLVICANNFRKKIMEEKFNLKDKVLVFENFRQLEFEDGFSKENLDDKYSYIFRNKGFGIISTSGAELERGTLKLIDAYSKLNFDKFLLLVGCKNDYDKSIVEDYIQKHKLENIFLVPRIDQNELKYLISKCQLGIAFYHKKNFNNLYCASGKVYEFIYEGLPIVTSNNPPLKNLVDNYNVGEAGDDLSLEITKVKNNYNFYKDNVRNFINDDVVKNGQNAFKDLLTKKLQTLLNGEK